MERPGQGRAGQGQGMLDWEEERRATAHSYEIAVLGREGAFRRGWTLQPVTKHMQASAGGGRQASRCPPRASSAGAAHGQGREVSSIWGHPKACKREKPPLEKLIGWARGLGAIIANASLLGSGTKHWKPQDAEAYAQLEGKGRTGGAI